MVLVRTHIYSNSVRDGMKQIRNNDLNNNYMLKTFGDKRNFLAIAKKVQIRTGKTELERIDG